LEKVSRRFPRICGESFPIDASQQSEEVYATPLTGERNEVTFPPSGSVSRVDVEAPYAGTATGACIAQPYRGASVPAFAGGPLSVGKTFAIER
jgi:hypothetical protein